MQKTKLGEAYEGVVKLPFGVQNFYENEGVKGALMQAQGCLAGKGSIWIEPHVPTELTVRVYHEKKELAMAVGEQLLSKIREVIGEEEEIP